MLRRALVGLLALAAACSGAQGPVPMSTPKPVTLGERFPSFIFGAEDFSYRLNVGRVQGGVAAATMVNAGSREHMAQFFRLRGGTSLEEFRQALGRGLPKALEVSSLAGGIGPIRSRQSQRVAMRLQPGRYALACLLIDPESGKAHWQLGQLAELTVAPLPSGVPVGPPEAEQTIALRDMSISLPRGFPATAGWYRVRNDGPQPHQIVFFRLPPGRTATELRQALSPPGPLPTWAEAMGGSAGFAKGQEAYLWVGLPAGRYAAVCLIEDAKTGRPHVAAGMIRAFAVERGAPPSATPPTVTPGELTRTPEPTPSP